jgi:endonuclease/exonuclease/phosphatase family metal-dependent hydrolase
MDSAAPLASRVTLATYNVRRCLGTDRVISPARIAEVIAESGADIVALQELDVGRLRSGGVDQARAIAEQLGFAASHFHPALRIEAEEYGDAILTRQQSRLVKVGFLPGGRGLWPIEPRGAIWVEVPVGDRPLQVINTHFGLRRGERRLQAAALLGPEWLGQCRAPYVLAGDLNSMPRGRVYRSFATAMRDVQTAGAGGAAAPTFPSRRPLLRIDHIFVSPDIQVEHAAVLASPRARIASDHLPLVARLALGQEGAR